MTHYLFIHQNFPGQFRHVAPALARAGHAVRAMVLRAGEPGHWQGVEVWPYTLTQRPVAGQHPWLMDMQSKVLRGQACFEAMCAMRAQGYRPDVVVAHPGWGESLFVREVWPEARFIVYGEYFYRATGGDMAFDPEFSQQTHDDEAACKLRLRNANHLLHLDAADAVISPTQWQASTFPQAYRHKIEVIHDGIDTDALGAMPARTLTLQSGVQLTPDDELVTFVSRNLEPYRGYHIFMRALPELLRQRPKARVLLIGGDEVSYGVAAPKGQTWKQIFIDEVRPQLPPHDWARVHFLGKLPYEQFLAVLKLAAVHVYLTYPFVLSWSLLEAMALGRAIVGSDTAPVREVITHGVNGRLVNFFDVSALAQQVAELLGDAAERERLGQAAAHSAQAYDLHRVCLPAQLALLQAEMPPRHGQALSL